MDLKNKIGFIPDIPDIYSNLISSTNWNEIVSIECQIKISNNYLTPNTPNFKELSPPFSTYQKGINTEWPMPCHFFVLNIILLMFVL